MITSTSTAEVAVTVAVRGLFVSSAISPNQSPGPSCATFFPFLVTRRRPLDEDEELATGSTFSRDDGSLAEIELVRARRECA